MHTNSLLLSSCTLCIMIIISNLIIDIRATELHNESEEAKRDNKVGMGTCEVSESGSELLGKTSYVVCISLHIRLIPYRIVRIFQGPKPSNRRQFTKLLFS